MQGRERRAGRDRRQRQHAPEQRQLHGGGAPGGQAGIGEVGEGEREGLRGRQAEQHDLQW